MRVPVNRLLLGEWPAVGTCRIQAADVVLQKFGVGERADHRAGLGEPSAVRAPGRGRMGPQLVRDHDHAVLGDTGIEFERGDPDGQRGGKCRERVLRGQAACAAMTLQVQGERGKSRQQGEAARPAPRAIQGAASSSQAAFSSRHFFSASLAFSSAVTFFNSASRSSLRFWASRRSSSWEGGTQSRNFGRMRSKTIEDSLRAPASVFFRAFAIDLSFPDRVLGSVALGIGQVEGRVGAAHRARLRRLRRRAVCRQDARTRMNAWPDRSRFRSCSLPRGVAAASTLDLLRPGGGRSGRGGKKSPALQSEPVTSYSPGHPDKATFHCVAGDRGGAFGAQHRCRSPSPETCFSRQVLTAALELRRRNERSKRYLPRPFGDVGRTAEAL